MLPKRTEWQSWTPLERTAYLAQVAAALALLPTVLFAWLSFREARLARADQARYFQAEKAPLVELQALEKREHLLVAIVKNVGDSPARELTFWYKIANTPKPCNVAVSVDKNDTNVRLIERGETAEFIVAALGDFKDKCGVMLDPLPHKPARSYSTDKDPPSLQLLIVWKDIADGERARKYEAELRRQ